ncbi:hypothetical protein H6F51_14240 [Cyanobacteria bacterium FACHB-DQ100]|nr:hypothetical protein [Cyanobacteria bacterium FACHB-DQ100]
MSNNAISRDDFDQWIFLMDDALEEFFQSLPAELRGKLDHSISSLDVIEGWILSKYRTIQEIQAPGEATVLDGLARYVGETFRKNLGGYWDIDLKNEKSIYFNFPVITGYKENSTPIGIHSLVTASIDRRTGEFIKTVLLNTLDR